MTHPMEHLTRKIPAVSAIYACDRFRQQLVRCTFLMHLVSDPFGVRGLCDDAPACVMQLDGNEVAAVLCLIGCMLAVARQTAA